MIIIVEASTTAFTAITLAFGLTDREIDGMGRKLIRLSFEAGAIARITHFVEDVSCCQSSVQVH